MKSTPSYKAVIFDLFGTLVPCYSVRENDLVIQEMGRILDISPEGIWCWYRDHWDECATGRFPTVEMTIENICMVLGAEVKPEAVQRTAQKRIEFTQKSVVAYKNTIDILHQLHLAGYKLGLISDCGVETPTVWPSTNLAPMVDTAVFSCVVGLKKPDPRIYHLASLTLEVLPNEYLYVGDGSSRELSGALAIGMDAVLLRIPLDDAYDAQREDVSVWSGSTISTLRDILPLLGLS